MFHNPPKEKLWLSWMFVVLWTGVIFATIPLARTVRMAVREAFGVQVFLYFTVGVVVTVTVLAVIRLRVQRSETSSMGFVWLAAVATAFIGYAFSLRANPEEAVHFVEYGVLGMLIFRALSHRVRDQSIYFGAALIGAMIGTVDEMVQWAVPKRFWALGDIWLNLLAVALVQLGIAKGMRPRRISSDFGATSTRWLCRLAAVLLLLISANLLNTPDRIAWYAERVPQLRFLIENESVMFEYGYKFKDPDIGVFRSRLSPAELKAVDAERGAAAAAILDRFQDPSQYGPFLETYTPSNDPFLHEARVHLFRRDRYLGKAKKLDEGSGEFRYRLTVAYRENQIMEKYFGNTLGHSSYSLAAEDIDFMADHLLQDQPYESAVSRTLVTGIREKHTLLILAALFASVGFLYAMPGRERKPALATG